MEPGLLSPFGAKVAWLIAWLFFWWLLDIEFVVVTLLALIAYKNLFPYD